MFLGVGRMDPDPSPQNQWAVSKTFFYSDPKHGISNLVGEAVELKEKVQVLNTAHDGLIARVGEPDHGLEPWPGVGWAMTIDDQIRITPRLQKGANKNISLCQKIFLKPKI